MAKQTQTIRWQKLTNCLSVFDHFVGLALKGLSIDIRSSFMVAPWIFQTLTKTIFVRQRFLTDAIDNWVPINCWGICRILIFYHCRFADLFAFFSAFVELKSIVAFFFFFTTSSNCCDIDLLLIFGEQYMCFYHPNYPS